jgi:adenosylcobinamide-GDP ribazoletransferase
MRALRTEFLYFLGAVQFLTRLPTPHLHAFSVEWLDRGVKYFPLTGILIGSLCAAVFVAASALWSGALPALLAIAAGVAITGAFHEDGFADFFDSMGGGTRQARLEIMKDSRLGTFGVLAIGFAISAKVAALSCLSLPVAVAALIAAHSGGRFAAVAIMPTMPYAGDAATGKAKPLATNITAFGLAVAAAFGLPPLFLLPISIGLKAALAGGLASIFIAWRARRLLGGFTGDVLGAIEQSYEIAFLLAVAACV